MSEKVKNILTWVFLGAIVVGFILSCVFDWGEKCTKCGKGFYSGETVYLVGTDKYHNDCKPAGYYK